MRLIAKSLLPLFTAALLAACGGSSKKPAETTPKEGTPAEEAKETPGEEAKEHGGEMAKPNPEDEAKKKEEEMAMAAQKEVGEQVEAGKKLFADKCAVCHGDNGEGGGKNPAVVGDNALPLDPPKGAKKRKGVQFKTAADVLAWVSKNMPLKKPGSLTADEYAAILAFDLQANKVELKQKVDAASAADIVLHP